VGLKAGMTASATITTQRKENVLLVPSRAIKRTGGQQVVEVTKDGQTEQRTVRTGITDGQQTEITSGLEEGEQVVIQTSTTTTTTTTGQQRQINIGPGMEIFGR
jgi:macrolide-specific efflux system membrane fusion protein